MYRHCISCSADLGANEALEAFPVGTRLAFDAAKGRLWAVCPKCARWNLSPVEERWEAVEAAERLFVDTRLRVQSENVGMAKLRDGTRLVRVGAALPRELAAWRYGTELTRRRRRVRLQEGTSQAVDLVVSAVSLAALVLSGPLGWLGSRAFGAVLGMVHRPPEHAVEREVLHVLAPDEVVVGSPRPIRQADLAGAFTDLAEDGDLRLHGYTPSGRFELRGAAARNVLARTMVQINRRGASAQEVESAVDVLAAHPSVDSYLGQVAGRGMTLFAPAVDMADYYRWRAGMEGVPAADRLRWQLALRSRMHVGADAYLPLEMALHEERERRAMEGELALLESAWREAEAIAAIADRLAGEDGAALPPRDGSGLIRP